MLRSDIITYLRDGGSFLAGLQLLERGGAASARRHRIVAQKTFVQATDKERLRGDLVALLQALPADTVVDAPRATRPTKPVEKPADTPTITALRNKGVALLKERSDLKSRLLVAALDEPDRFSDAERYELAELIMDGNVPALDDTYGAIRRFEEEGVEPASDAEQRYRQGILDAREINSIRPQISRMKKAQRNGRSIDEAKLSALEARLVELEERAAGALSL